jgi:hypothetical protein
VCARELFYSPEALQNGSIQKFSLDVSEADILMNWICNLTNKLHINLLPLNETEDRIMYFKCFAFM